MSKGGTYTALQHIMNGMSRERVRSSSMSIVNGEETEKVIDGEPPRRKILSLRSPPSTTKVVASWRCKPCGSDFEVDSALGDAEVVRCPSCRARLGKAGQFRSNGPDVERVRARRFAPQTPQPSRMGGEIHPSPPRRTSQNSLTVVTRRSRPNRTATDHSARGSVQTISGRAE